MKLFCMHPVKMMIDSKLEVHKDKTLREATEMAYKVCCFFFVFLTQFILEQFLFLSNFVQYVQRLIYKS